MLLSGVCMRQITLLYLKKCKNHFSVSHKGKKCRYYPIFYPNPLLLVWYFVFTTGIGFILIFGNVDYCGNKYD